MKNSKPYAVKENLVAELNSVLKKIAEKKNSNYRKIAVMLGIPTNSSDCVTKNISGYIGIAKNYLRRECK